MLFALLQNDECETGEFSAMEIVLYYCHKKWSKEISLVRLRVTRKITIAVVWGQSETQQRNILTWVR